MIDISGVECQQISARNSASCIDYIVLHRGKQGLNELFEGILLADSLESNCYAYHNTPLNLAFFQNIDNWYTNEISIQMFDNVKKMGVDPFDLGYHSVIQAANTKNIAVAGIMRALGPKKMAQKVSSINSLYNKTKTSTAKSFTDNHVIIDIQYHPGFRHTPEITRQNIGAFVAAMDLVGQREIEFEILFDDFAAENGKTQFKLTWQHETLFNRLRWFAGKLVSKYLASTYLNSHEVVQDYHSELVNSLQDEIKKKEAASKKNEEYYQALIKTKQEQTQLLENEVSRKTVALQRALDDKQQLFNDFSHEVRTPLMLALNPIKRVRDFSKDPKCQSLLATAQTNLEDLETLFKQLYRLERINQHTAEKESIDLKFVASRVIESVKYLAADLSIDIQSDIPSDLLVLVYPGTIELVLKNILENALKYCEIGDKLKIHAAEKDPETMSLIIEDSGPGVPQSHREKIFQRFHRVPGVENIRGSGIGLAIVKQWLEKNDGQIYCTRSSLGGARFEVSLVNAKGAAIKTDTANYQQLKYEKVTLPEKSWYHNIESNTRTSEISDNPSLSESKPTILLVEDNYQLRNYLQTLFNNQFKCLTADDGEAGWKCVQSSNPSLVISDVMMPVLDGYNLTKRIKNNLETCHIPVILLTAKGDTDSQLTGLKFEADDYLAKPIDDDVLIQKSINIISQQSRLRERIRKEIERGNPVGEYLSVTQEEWKDKLDRFMESNYANEALTIGEIASELAMSERKLQLVFKKSLGMTPVAYRLLFRLNKAKTLIKQNPNDSLTKTAFDCGFNSLQSFSRAFKKQFGHSPTDFV